ncbi:MAG: type II toxin-antitoxin system HicB family antitoxin [Bacteroidetes bacterium]|nr:MAG: type II toxin-antitoxin system HicB family antitoxin [Bacteroidota bacterium]
MQNIFTFKIEPDEGEFHAWIPELPGCHTHGKTVAEATQNLKDAMRLYLEVELEKNIAEQALEFA